MRIATTTFAALFLCASLTPANAVRASSSDVRRADQAVAHQAVVTRRAIKGGDVATIATERAKLKAVKAVAWGKRHPAISPAQVVASN
jgi:hypothetical protein